MIFTETFTNIGIVMQGRFILFLIVALIPSVSVAAESDSQGIDFFEKQIRPVLVNKCYRCHSVEAASKNRLKGNLYLDSRVGIRKGGDTGPAVVPNDVQKSIIIQALKYENKAFEMPPSGKLSENVINDFVKWIERGAPDPRDGTVVKKTDEIDIEAGRKFWSIRPFQQVQIPTINDTHWPRSEIDRFILSKLEAKQLKPVNDASALDLVRRLYFDLIGLPPTPEQIDGFLIAVKKDRLSAITTLVDQLLLSPRFGERWGRHWLDVARFGESNGGTKNTVWPDAWRYRDYVIDSFNKDKPFNQFVREQLARDLLPANTEQKRKEQLVATAFLAMGSKPAAVPRMEIIGEQLDVMGRAFLGISIGCARCHDHKFDPVPTSDFYAMAGIMLNTQIQDGKPFGSLEKIEKSARTKYKNFQRSLSTATGAIEKSLVRLDELCRQGKIRRWPTQSWEEVIAKLSAGQRSKAEKTLKELRKAQTDLEKLRKENPPKVFETLAVADRAAKGRNFLNAKIHIRGSEQNLGDEIPRNVMQVLRSDERLKIGEKESGRLQLANVIDRHPLTARVMVNRIWHHLFGRGIVRTTDNLGTLGDRPSHPELLDWLASRFIEEGWSTKKMIRRIVLSRAYQLTATVDEFDAKQALQIDPGNTLIWKHSARRLEAEALRDAMLAASGQLDVEPPTRFDSLGYHSRMADITAMDRIRNRAVYLPVSRGYPTDIMAVMNFPPADLVVGRRETSSVPTQALFLLNSPLVLEQAQRLALGLLNDNKRSDTEKIDRACLLTWGRQPSTEETQEALAFIKQHQQQSSEQSDEWKQLDAWSAWCQSLFCAAEFRFLR